MTTTTRELYGFERYERAKHAFDDARYTEAATDLEDFFTDLAAARAADDQQRLAFAAVARHAQAVEQQLPGGNGGERQRGGGGIIQRTRFAGDDALIH